MSEWRKYKICEIAEVVGGGTPSTSVGSFWNGDIPWLTPRDLTGYNKTYISRGERNISNEGLKNSSSKIIPKGSVLLTSRAPIGYVAIAQNELCTNQGFKSLIPNIELALSEYLYYWVKNNSEYLQSIGTGTTFLEISSSVVKDIDIQLPPLLEQKAIAAVLSSLDDKIDLLHRQNKTLEAMAETLFRQWFVEEAQEEWEELPLSSVADFLNGLACQKYPPTNGVEKLPVLKIKELSGGISESTDRVTSNVKPEYIVSLGDVIFSWSGSLIVKLWDGEKCVLNQHLFKVTSTTYPKWFYLLWCKHHLPEFVAIAKAHATTMGHIKRSDLVSAMVLVPSEKEFLQMSAIMKPLLDKQIANYEQLAILIKLRDTLLPKLMSGEVMVDY